MIIENSFSKRSKGLLCFLFLFLIVNVSAAIDTNNVDDVFKLHETIDYAKPCFFNNTYCTGSAMCNFTVFKPDNTIAINNVQSSNNGAYHNLNITFNEIGIWKVDIVCTDSGLQGAETFYAQVTGGGFNDTVGFYLIILIFSLGIIMVGFWMEDSIIILFGSFGLYFLGIYTLFNGIVGMKDTVTTWAIGIIVLGIAMYFSVRSAHELITNGG